jgi:hypothetical protein
MSRFSKLVGLCVVGAACAAFAPDARAADVPISEQARTHFAAGVALLQDPKAPRYEEAYREFKAAYAASPSYKILGNLGLCAMKIERDEEAIHAYETYLAEAGPDVGAAEREQIQRDLLTLKSGLVHVTVSSDPVGATIVDVRTPVQGSEIRNVYGETSGPMVLSLRRGHHIITARLTGYVDQTWEFDTGGDTAPPPHAFTMVRVLSAGPTMIRERPIPVSAWATGGLAVALGAGSAIVGAFAIDAHNKYVADNTGMTESKAQSDRSTGKTLNAVADGLLLGAIVSGGFAIYFVATRPAVERPLTGSAGSAGSRPSAPKASLWPTEVSPTWSPHGGPGFAAGWVF